MSFTLNDFSAELPYSDTWAVQPPSDPNLSSFFLQTYHVAQAQGATLNLSFTGSAIASLGSRVPVTYVSHVAVP
ncbi:hypothetical protein B0H21DRAFT_702923 [Amylocystis lapponica]|nr:hypothetical protein B0H21DRAFT_702923 [Amylocystis lapponica]